jgi:hypothetical protein
LSGCCYVSSTEMATYQKYCKDAGGVDMINDYTFGRYISCVHSSEEVDVGEVTRRLWIKENAGSTNAR